MGATNAGRSTSRKFGYAMQEVVRAFSFRSWEEGNGNFSELGLAQGFIIQQYIAFFSGVRRKIALAVSCSNCIQAMIKCGHDPRPTFSGTYGPLDLAELDEHLLENAWREWALGESQRRLCYSSYILDAHVSLSHGIQSIVPWVDMNLPLPAPDELWTAKTSIEWKQAMLGLFRSPRPPRPVCLGDVLADPVVLTTHGGLTNTDFAASSFLAGMWTLIRELHRFDRITHKASTWSSLLVSSRRAELLSVLNLFESQYIASQVVSSKMRLLCEAISMHAMVTPDDLVLPKLTTLPLLNKVSVPSTTVNGLKLSTNFEYRAALWRTGRILHAAARWVPGELNGVYIVALFHAAILLWWYCIKLLCQDRHVSGTCISRACVCVLDGDSSLEHQVLGGQFELALLGQGPDSPPVPLMDVPGTMECIILHSPAANPMDAESSPYIFERDVSIQLKSNNQTVARANVYRPRNVERAPVLITYGPYGKDIPYQDFLKHSFDEINPKHKSAHSSFETPDPGFWTKKGYVVLRVDEAGVSQSPGLLDTMSQNTTDAFYEVIEWAAEQSWSNGKVGLIGTSYFAGTQWRVASRRPRGLACIVPYEGMADYYRDRSRQGGIAAMRFLELWFNRQCKSNQYGLRASRKWVPILLRAT
ncbi:alpha beta-hydrolase [Fusarium agapanthi]|uniref:Alpha beta-hydrolase n=1 Tax=Fusarium agapanthi TaxID=1803897 RepID=A0A9P5BHG3_9HYPO|nr:alpha beta-hydrolase [Fusarium agapanthi]